MSTMPTAVERVEGAVGDRVRVGADHDLAGADVPLLTHHDVAYAVVGTVRVVVNESLLLREVIHRDGQAARDGVLRRHEVVLEERELLAGSTPSRPCRTLGKTAAQPSSTGSWVNAMSTSTSTTSPVSTRSRPAARAEILWVMLCGFMRTSQRGAVC